MKIAGRVNYLAAIESVAMTDIVLNLFIFFFISFSLLYTFNPQRTQRLKIKLPEAASAAPFQGHDRVTIAVTDKGSLYLGDELVSDGELRTRIRQLQKSAPQLSVMLKADQGTPFRHVVNVLDAVNAAGVRNLSVAVTPKR
ncbi:MAG: biopolymer transporter ExbD [Candidatus Aureabacteria bacterium]|nr:biopolymer transporter ExbD [Candidatus Auribacterota bacterium]